MKTATYQAALQNSGIVVLVHPHVRRGDVQIGGQRAVRAGRGVDALSSRRGVHEDVRAAGLEQVRRRSDSLLGIQSS